MINKSIKNPTLIQKLREKNNLLMTQLGEKIEGDYRKISSYEHRKVIPSLWTIWKLSKILNCSISALVNDYAVELEKNHKQMKIGALKRIKRKKNFNK